MDIAELLLDGFGRIAEEVASACHGLGRRQLAFRPDGAGNSIAWLIWHLTRVQDDHVAELADTAQVWTEHDWVGRFDLGLPAADTGYGHGPSTVAAVIADADLLLGYHRAVFDRTQRYLAGLTSKTLSRIVDAAYDPPVSVGIRLVSVLSDDLQHVGQAAYVRGLLPSG